MAHICVLIKIKLRSCIAYTRLNPKLCEFGVSKRRSRLSKVGYTELRICSKSS